MARNKADLKLQVGTTYGEILRITLPIAASILVPQINFITNNIFLGQLGQQSLAIAGITGVYYLIFAVIGFGLNSGLQALLSRRAGENRKDEIGSLFTHAIRISLVFALLGIGVTFFMAPAILQLSLSNTNHAAMAVDFMRIRIWGLPFLYLYQMRNALLVSTNLSRYLIAGTLAETCSNIFLDYCLIFGHFGFAKMGFNGAALASVIAEFIGFVTVFGVIHYKGIAKQLDLYNSWKFSRDKILLILNQSAPLILQFSMSIMSWEFFYILIEHHGERDLAVSNTMRNIFGLFGCVTWAFASATTSMVSNVIGQGMQQKVFDLIKKIIRLSLMFSLLVGIILNISPGFLLSIYGQDEVFIEAAIPVVRIISVALLMQSASTVWLNAVVGTGNSKMNLITESIAIVLYVSYVYFTLEYLNLSIEWGWLSEWLYWISLFIPSYWYMRSGKWKSKLI